VKVAGLRRWCAAAAVGLLALAAPGGAGAEERIELTPAVQASLLHLQELWIQWLAAFNQNDPQRTGEVLSDLVAVSQQLGMEALPDLSLAALVRGRGAALAGDPQRARLALAAAERLDAGRPETAFARADVEWAAGRWPQAAAAWLDGHRRLLLQPRERRLWTSDAAVEVLYLLLAAGGLFVALQMAVNGRPLLADLAAAVGRRLPAWAVTPGVLVLLLWPLLLPAGLAWLVLWWSLLLWTYGSTSERLVFGLLWLVAGLTPLAVATVRERVAVELSPPARALEQAARGRLYGTLFSDLGLVKDLLPEEPAVDHFLADLHRRIGQWERARTLYLRVLEQEPANAAALNDLASYYFYKGDYGTARSRFTEATEAAPRDALPFFNLGQSYSIAYLFDEAGSAMTTAQELAPTRVRGWVDETGEGSVLAADGGFARLPAIRRRLAGQLAGPAPEGVRAMELLRQGWSLLVAAGLLLAAVGFHVLRRRLGDGGKPPPPPRPGAWTLVLVPGVDSLLRGQGFAALGGLLVPALLLLLAFDARFGFDLTVGYAHGAAGMIVALGLLALLMAARLWIVLRGEG
jgi:tetratricopeptide (TPR) repeat protein